MTDAAISIRDLVIRFRMSYDRVYSMKERARAVAQRFVGGREPEYFEALRGVSFEAHAGDIVGLIGANGSGKTTFLRATSGIYAPDAGEVTSSGRISTLLSLGTGFNNKLSGRDNIMVGGLLIGMTPAEIEKRVPEIVHFAGVEKFVDVPMKYYSKGMIARLSFAIVLAMQPDIVLIDEVFSVGDLAFKEKSERAMHDLLSRARIQLIVTHSLSLVREHCNRALLFDSGKIVADGAPDEVVDLYESRAS